MRGVRGWGLGAGREKAAAAFLGTAMILASPSWLLAKGKAGATGAAFLKIAPGARAAALGEAFTAVADDASAIQWNPAGLGWLKKSEFTATHGQWIQQSDHNYLAAAVPARWGTLGISITSFSVPDIAKRAADTDAADGTFDSRDAAYGVAWGRALGDRWSVGATAAYVRQTLDGHSAGAPMLNLGALWRTAGGRFTAGAAVRNLGGEIKFDEEGDPLPMTAAAGAAYRTLNGRLLLSGDVRVPAQGDAAESVGIELSRPLFRDGRGALRAGYDSSSAEAVNGTGLALGTGLSFGRWGFDLTWAPYGVLGDTFRYGFRVLF